MMNWLQKYSGLRTRGTNIEKIELDNLSKEIKYYKKKYAKENEEMLVPSDKEEEISPDDQKKIDENIKKRQQKKKEMRDTISAEVYGDMNKAKNFVPREYEKTNEQKEMIKNKCKQCFLFKMDESDLNTVINSFKQVNVSKDEPLFKQGDSSDSVYFIEEGELECSKTYRKGDPPTFIKTYKPNEFIGLSALLYNDVRDCTITAKTNAILWSLDRENFRNILKDSNMKKREKYLEILQNCEIFQNFEIYETKYVILLKKLNLKKEVK